MTEYNEAKRRYDELKKKLDRTYDILKRKITKVSTNIYARKDEIIALRKSRWQDEFGEPKKWFLHKLFWG